ncbi:hypothetical protein B0T24DRAFT_699032 [Lasiosphaeria ovina]|uniref:Protein kinase domain-containing protein n=1 Tax=Lasiosphaeria ovina TaxID=92902 RepID=A0AAE0KGZ3_9PEZI|nr:hypothetical protein B0T24DRAFT_699032 [Lasiosphaeria ovina]
MSETTKTTTKDQKMGRYSYLFTHRPTGDKYLFVRNIASGLQSHAQLVQNMDTDELLVRKVSVRRCKSNEEPKLGVESEILDLLKSFPRPESAADQPHLAELLYKEDRRTKAGDEDERVRQETKESGTQRVTPRLDTYYHISYWKFYNCGTLRDLWTLKPRGAIKPLRIPYAVMARSIRQVCATFQFMYRAGPEAVYHRDAHGGNIFVHYEACNDLPDFYLGDFDLSKTASQAQAETKEFFQPGNQGVKGRAPPLDITLAGRRPEADLYVFINEVERGATAAAAGGDVPRPDYLKTRYANEYQRHYRAQQVQAIMQARKDGNNPTIAALQPPPEVPAEPVTHMALLEDIVEMLRTLRTEESELARTRPQSRPVDLTMVIQAASNLERACLSAGPLDERRTETYLAFCEAGRELAGLKGPGPADPRPFVFRAPSQEAAMRPVLAHPQRLGPWGETKLQNMPQVIYGPWQLLRLRYTVAQDARISGKQGPAPLKKPSNDSDDDNDYTTTRNHSRGTMRIFNNDFSPVSKASAAKPFYPTRDKGKGKVTVSLYPPPGIHSDFSDEAPEAPDSDSDSDSDSVYSSDEGDGALHVTLREPSNSGASSSTMPTTMATEDEQSDPEEPAPEKTQQPEPETAGPPVSSPEQPASPATKPATKPPGPATKPAPKPPGSATKPSGSATTRRPQASGAPTKPAWGAPARPASAATTRQPTTPTTRPPGSGTVRRRPPPPPSGPERPGSGTPRHPPRA